MANKETIVIQEAGDPGTPPERLGELAGHRRLAVLRAVVQNPSAPPEALGALAWRFPRELLKNPALGALAVREPARFREILFRAAGPLLKVPGLPESYLLVLAEHPDSSVRERMARRLDMPGPVLGVLARGKEYSIGCILANHPRTPADVLSRLAETLGEDTGVLFDLVRHPSTPVDVLTSLALRKDFLRGEMPDRALVAMARDGRREVQLISAEHPRTPPDALAAIVEATLGPGELEVPNWVMRERVAGNPGAGPDLLERLARDRSARVRLAVADNRCTPPALLVSLSNDEDVLVRAGVARHPSTPEHVLADLVRDPDYAVRHEVPEARLKLLARHPMWEVRAAVAAHDEAPAALLQRLARDEHAEVRAAVAGNPFMGGVLNQADREAIQKTLDRRDRSSKKRRRNEPS